MNCFISAKVVTLPYPWHENKNIHNSPGVFCCIRAGANTGAACVRTVMNSIKCLADMRKMSPAITFSCIRASANAGPHAFAQKFNSPRSFSCVYWFCSGGYSGASFPYVFVSEGKDT